MHKVVAVPCVTSSSVHDLRDFTSFSMPQVGIPGWLEAFAAHPRIGDVNSLRKKFASTADWCESSPPLLLQRSGRAVLAACEGFPVPRCASALHDSPAALFQV